MQEWLDESNVAWEAACLNKPLNASDPIPARYLWRAHICGVDKLDGSVNKIVIDFESDSPDFPDNETVLRAAFGEKGSAETLKAMLGKNYTAIKESLDVKR
jgi:hypothetical protein